MASEIRVGNYIVLSDRKYTKTDEWVKVEGDIAIVGITDYAQKKLRDIVGVELPEVGREVKKGEAIVAIESVKAAADAYAPISGEIIEVNEKLLDEPETINKDPYGEGWLVKISIKKPEELKELLTPEQYAEKIQKEES